MTTHQQHIKFIWDIADLLRGPYRPPQYERVMLPMTVLRRFDSVLESSKEEVINEYNSLKKKYNNDIPVSILTSKLEKITGQKFYNTSPFTFERLKGAPDSIAQDLVSYINGFSPNVRQIFEFFDFEKEIFAMNDANILYLIVSEFAKVNLHPTMVSNRDMGLIFENLIRRFNELANETAGDHFTPREIIKLMVNILFIDDDNFLQGKSVIREIMDPTCGTGGMLSEAKNHVKDLNEDAILVAYGQDYNKRAFATAAADLLIKNDTNSKFEDTIKYGDTLVDDQFTDKNFDYLIANPPFGVDWKKQKPQIERDKTGRFTAGLPRVNDGALLFLQHMISKFEPYAPQDKKYGSRLAIVFSGSPMFSGGAGSGESDIRKWIIENDWLESIIALPEQMFYNTGITTYIWVLTNRKKDDRKGKIQLFDARDFYIPMRKSQGSKRRKMGEGNVDDGIIQVMEPDHIAMITQEYGLHTTTEHSKIFDNADFGFTRVTIERPLRLKYQMSLVAKTAFLDACPHLLDDVQAIDKKLGRAPLLDWNKTLKEIKKINQLKWSARELSLFRSVFTTKDPEAEKVLKSKDEYEADADLRDFENIPLKIDIQDYFKNEVLPFVPDAWMDRTKDKVGYEINFNRYFFTMSENRSLDVINKELNKVEDEILKMLQNSSL
ncbi:type I restriction-modification system subunit M [Flavobacterium covae]|uniref:type I restriction-modification system subunit M n=1 Tax=Flavobacterium covae TaxID=2906076 RepID=UPI000745E37F|nr:class I SAM-dependent DNA methyltransferase [Flavobacterium covae]AMA49503.1 DNA methyltransferase [Flavobacterium covae]AND63202.1 DNA methyltransferase [Flavobacterium covae]MCJ1810244.1 type I restriction-modification system subunit M [Flavobacterium covae]